MSDGVNAQLSSHAYFFYYGCELNRTNCSTCARTHTMADRAVRMYNELMAQSQSTGDTKAIPCTCVVFRISQAAVVAPMTPEAKHSIVQNVLNRLSIKTVRPCVDEIVSKLPVQTSDDAHVLAKTLLQSAVVQSTNASVLASLIRQLAGCKRPTYDGTLLAGAINSCVKESPMSGKNGGRLFVQLCNSRVRLLTSETVASVWNKSLADVHEPDSILFATGCAEEALACKNCPKLMQPLHDFMATLRQSERQGSYSRVHALQDNLLGA